MRSQLLLLGLVVCATLPADAQTITPLPGLTPPEPVVEKVELRDDAQVIRQKLKKRISVDWHSMKFEAVMTSLGRELDVAVELDPEGLEEAGVVSDQEMGWVRARNRRGDHLLRLILEPINMSYAIRHGVVYITSEEKAAESLVTRTYVVRDLVTSGLPPGEERPASPVPVPTDAKVVWGSDDPFAGAQDYDTLIDLITSTVSPDSWTDNGGQGSISGFRGLLIVSQTEFVHDEIEALLKQIRTGERSRPGEVIDIAPSSEQE